MIMRISLDDSFEQRQSLLVIADTEIKISQQLIQIFIVRLDSQSFDDFLLIFFQLSFLSENQCFIDDFFKDLLFLDITFLIQFMRSLKKFIRREQRQVFIKTQFLFEVIFLILYLCSSLLHHLILHPVQSAEAIDFTQYITAPLQDFLEKKKCQPSDRESEQSDG